MRKIFVIGLLACFVTSGCNSSRSVEKATVLDSQFLVAEVLSGGFVICKSESLSRHGLKLMYSETGDEVSCMLMKEGGIPTEYHVDKETGRITVLSWDVNDRKVYITEISKNGSVSVYIRKGSSRQDKSGVPEL
jgi:hypothetical protein